jgi:23S rRNA (cytidine2498-2'-O)-methyltransferase
MSCRPGAEAALKSEVSRVEPEWRFAYSRPGLVTFKHAGERPLDVRRLAERRWVFAHAHGISLGKVTGEKRNSLAEQVWQLDGVAAALSCVAPFADIHVWQLDSAAGRDEGASFQTPLTIEIEQALRAAAPDSCVKVKKQAAAGESDRRHGTPRGELVLDVIVLEPGLWWIGYHFAATAAERWPGGAVPAMLPAHAVSRAYAKLEEAIAWSGLPIAAGDECVEIGCAPGGASQALLDRGLFVTGIDPADVDPLLLEHPRFRHLKKRGPDVRRREFLGVRWLVADMNIAPQATLDDVEPIVTHPGVTIRGLVLTLKLSDWNAAGHLDEWAARVRGWGYRDVRMRQLVSGGQEVCLVALRRKTLRRLGRKSSGKGKAGRRRMAGKTAETPLTRHDEPHQAAQGPHF